VAGPVDIETALEKINSLKRQIDQIGGIDPEIEKEYIETKERFDYLENQTHDLNEAVGSLEKVIKELDVIIKERFDKEFKHIAEKFEEYFKILFNGGSAKIVKVLTEELPENKNGEKNETNATESTAEEQAVEDKFATNLKRIKYLQKYNATGLAGIEILATPPGKKIKVITMLSGGERALTAIGLICAIISCNPAPFVVLDEVDASLDEANSERLAKILDDLSHKTQFIVITHNRASMRRANILYGVTMEESGVSKLLSIKLDEASAVVKN
jgi:chromosome segregation protein